MMEIKIFGFLIKNNSYEKKVIHISDFLTDIYNYLTFSDKI